jgi:hypothetical protein
MRSIDLLDDAVGVGGPDEGFGFAVVLAEVSVDGGLQVLNAHAFCDLRNLCKSQWPVTVI